MKRLIDITDEDVISVINRIHLLTENKVISRNGLLGLDFYESFRKYGDCSIDVELASNDTVTDGYYTIISKCRIQFHHESVWFTELGYKLPDAPQWT